MKVYHCKHCQADKTSLCRDGKNVEVRFPNGHIDRYLTCGHKVSVNLLFAAMRIVMNFLCN